MKQRADLIEPISGPGGDDRPPAPPPIVLVGRRPDDADDGVAALVRSDRDNMIRLARQLTGCEAAARQIVGDALVEVHRRWGRLPDPVGALRTGVVERADNYARVGTVAAAPQPARDRLPLLRWFRRRSTHARRVPGLTCATSGG